MAKAKSICSIPKCGKPASCRTWCQMHYTRFKRHGDPNATLTAPEGDGLRFLYSAMEAETDDCIEWPYSRSSGYGQTYYAGRVQQTHRLICKLVHGEPDGPMQAAHRCGNRTCVNPKHIRWATSAENIADKEAHGTKLIGSATNSAKLTEADVVAIRGLRGKMSPPKIAAIFGVNAVTIRRVLARETWRHVAA